MNIDIQCDTTTTFKQADHFLYQFLLKYVVTFLESLILFIEYEPLNIKIRHLNSNKKYFGDVSAIF